VIPTRETASDAFREVQTLGAQARQEVSSEDFEAFRALKKVSRIAEAAGRLTLIFSGHPLAWILGGSATAFHLALEAQLNHQVMHGSLDSFGPYSTRYRTWALPMRSETWREAHRLHHAHPSLLGWDPDTQHPFTRVHPALPSTRRHRFGPWVDALFAFELWAFDYDRLLKKRGLRAPEDAREIRHFLLHLGYHFGATAFLAEAWGGHGIRTLLALFLASLVRNGVFTSLQLASSVGETVSTRHALGRPSDWVRFQIETSKNFHVPVLFRPLVGGLDRHIEHHLFPSLPARRLHALSERVRDLSHRAGIRYEEHPSLAASLRSSLQWLAFTKS
jgi:fatty acid desaturase